MNVKFDGITSADLLAKADRFGVAKAELALSDVRAALGNWNEPSKQAGLTESKSDELAREFLLL